MVDYYATKKEWSNIQKECYERNCICEGCMYTKYNPNCAVKGSIIERVLKFGLPKDINTKGVLAE